MAVEVDEQGELQVLILLSVHSAAIIVLFLVKFGLVTFFFLCFSSCFFFRFSFSVLWVL